MAYQNINGGGIGTLLRMIAEEKTKTPIVPPSAEAASPQRGMIEDPILGAESPGSERMVSLQPEDVTAPVKPEAGALGVSRVGPLAIGGEDVTAMQPPVPQAPSIPGKGDMNVETGHRFAENPNRNWNWDDNYWANEVEPRLKSGWRPGGQQAQPQPDFSPSGQAGQSAQPQGQVLGTQISATPTRAVDVIKKGLPGGEYSPESQLQQLNEIQQNPNYQTGGLLPANFESLTGPQQRIAAKNAASGTIPTPTPTPAPQRNLGTKIFGPYYDARTGRYY
jgi:hypothetical protein